MTQGTVISIPIPTLEDTLKVIKEPSKEKKVPLVEMFGPTIQGEGSMCGTQTYFMRFGLCDYACGMCDSVHAVDPRQVKANAEWLTPTEIAQKFLASYNKDTTRWITLSGGNPCIHDLTAMFEYFKTNPPSGFSFAVETQGTLCPDWLKYCDQVTISPKGPGMREKIEFDKLDAFFMGLDSNGRTTIDQVCMKIVIFDERDLELVRHLYRRYKSHVLHRNWYLSLGNRFPPGLDTDIDSSTLTDIMVSDYRQLFDDIKADPILSQMKFLPQLHALIWGNDKGR